MIRVFLIMAFLFIGCSHAYRIDEIDEDSDGKIDQKIFWKKDGTLEKIILVNPPADSRGKNERLYSETEIVMVDGQKLNRQKDLSTWLPEETTYMYTEPFTLVFLEIHGKFNNFKVYWKKNKFHKILRDSNRDGKTDAWFYYNEDGKVVKTEIDNNFDGIVDETK